MGREPAVVPLHHLVGGKVGVHIAGSMAQQGEIHVVCDQVQHVALDDRQLVLHVGAVELQGGLVGVDDLLVHRFHHEKVVKKQVSHQGDQNPQEDHRQLDLYGNRPPQSHSPPPPLPIVVKAYKILQDSPNTIVTDFIPSVKWPPYTDILSRSVPTLYVP